MAYAEKTSIPLEQSIAQIISMAKKAGAQQVGQAEDDDGRHHVWFKLDGRLIRFSVPLVTEYRGPLKAGNGRQTCS